ncbi:SDR family NAD(P)-dependent oxidoreductase [Pseudonocardia nematodicida]|uniref:SDR family NAD(P)-dependent oxidoreductase n=1 Tax=Pseudonocardia nematodicida TaxID=1206997 RepID=A0ABV1K611_9PSEU
MSTGTAAERYVSEGRHAGRIVLVTGARGGLGSAACARLAAEGAVVVATDLKAPDGALTDTGGELALDVTDPDAWRTVVEAVTGRYGRIDALLMSHGSQGPECPIDEVPVDGWARTMRINLDSCFLGLRAVVPVMREQGHGRVLVLSSIAGRDGNEAMAAYSVAKAGVIALAKSAAKDVARHDVMINTVAPAMFQTPLTGDLSPERNAMLLSKVPMGRIGQPPEFAALAAWALSPECSYTTGHVFDLTGGRYTGD